MKKQLVIIGITALLVCVGLSGCNQVSNTLSPEKNRFVGTWKNTTSYMTLDLSSDGTCSMWSYTGTWDLKDGKLVIDLISVGIPYTYTYIFIFFNNNTLKLIPTTSTAGNGYVLYKQ
jgi:hypothetical protein